LSKWKFVLAAVAVLLFQSVAHQVPAQSGQFKGEVVASFMRDGRNMRLEKPFGYVDPKGRNWDVPEGAVTDGASIPRILWISYPPFTGKYRAAAVVHDYYCQTKSRPWREVHEVFYMAMRTAGVDDKTAKVMYGAVYNFGPRWGIGTQTRGAVTEEATQEEQARFLRSLEAWVAKDRPSLEEIGKRVDAGLGK
jgi:hypothetical protein